MQKRPIKSHLERFQESKEKLQNADKLTKSAVKDCEYLLSRHIDLKYDEIKEMLYGSNLESAWDILDTQTPSAKTLERKVTLMDKLIKKYKSNPEELAFLEGIRPKISDLFESHKDDIALVKDLHEKASNQHKAKLESREKEAENAKKSPIDLAPAPTRPALKKVDAALKNHIDSIRQELEENITKAAHSAVAKFRDARKENGDIRKLREIPGLTMVESIYLSQLTIRDGFGSRRQILLESDYQKKIPDYAARDAKSMIGKFHNKTLSKLATVCEGFGDIRKLELNVRTYIGTVEGNIKVGFEDDTSFEVRSQLVQSTAPTTGLPFYRYPTTFHDVSFRGQPKVSQMPTAELAKLGRDQGGPRLGR